MTLLVTRAVTKRFGGLLAVNKLDFDVEQGAIVSVIGPNGAGKTTFFNCIAGFYRHHDGRDRARRPADPQAPPRPDRPSRDVRTYQNIRLFANMTAMENILVGQHHHLTSTWIGTVLGTKSVQEDEKRAQDEARPPAALRRPARQGRHAREQAAVRRPAPARDRAGARQQAAPAPPRRADGGHEPQRNGPADRLHPQPARRARDHDPPHRARDAGGDGHLGAHHGARLRREDRRGQPGRDPVEPARHRGLPRARRRGGPRHRCQRCQRGERHEPRATPGRRRSDDGAPRGRRHPHVLRQHPRPQGRVAGRRRGRDRHAHRCQRRRQDDHPQHDLRDHPRRAAGPFASTDATSVRSPRTRSCPRASSRCPRAAGPSRASRSKRTCGWAGSPCPTRRSRTASRAPSRCSRGCSSGAPRSPAR